MVDAKMGELKYNIWKLEKEVAEAHMEHKVANDEAMGAIKKRNNAARLLQKKEQELRDAKLRLTSMEYTNKYGTVYG